MAETHQETTPSRVTRELSPSSPRDINLVVTDVDKLIEKNITWDETLRRGFGRVDQTKADISRGVRPYADYKTAVRTNEKSHDYLTEEYRRNQEYYTNLQKLEHYLLDKDHIDKGLDNLHKRIGEVEATVANRNGNIERVGGEAAAVPELIRARDSAAENLTNWEKQLAGYEKANMPFELWSESTKKLYQSDIPERVEKEQTEFERAYNEKMSQWTKFAKGESISLEITAENEEFAEKTVDELKKENAELRAQFEETQSLLNEVRESLEKSTEEARRAAEEDAALIDKLQNGQPVSQENQDLLNKARGRKIAEDALKKKASEYYNSDEYTNAGGMRQREIPPTPGSRRPQEGDSVGVPVADLAALDGIPVASQEQLQNQLPVEDEKSGLRNFYERTGTFLNGLGSRLKNHLSENRELYAPAAVGAGLRLLMAAVGIDPTVGADIVTGVGGTVILGARSSVENLAARAEMIAEREGRHSRFAQAAQRVASSIWTQRIATGAAAFGGTGMLTRLGEGLRYNLTPHEAPQQPTNTPGNESAPITKKPTASPQNPDYGPAFNSAHEMPKIPDYLTIDQGGSVWKSAEAWGKQLGLSGNELTYFTDGVKDIINQGSVLHPGDHIPLASHSKDILNHFLQAAQADKSVPLAGRNLLENGTRITDNQIDAATELVRKIFGQ